MGYKSSQPHYGQWVTHVSVDKFNFRDWTRTDVLFPILHVFSSLMSSDLFNV